MSSNQSEKETPSKPCPKCGAVIQVNRWVCGACFRAMNEDDLIDTAPDGEVRECQDTRDADGRKRD